MTQRSLTVRMNMRYKVPKPSTLCDLFELLHSSKWVGFISNQMIPYLKNSTPADPNIIKTFQKVISNNENCVICMNPIELNGIQVNCGHLFHEKCIISWLKLKSTCPSCRYQFPKELCGNYAICKINTAIVLTNDIQNSTNNIMEKDFYGIVIRTIVHVTLIEINKKEDEKIYKCQLNGILIGEQYQPIKNKRKLKELNIEIRTKLNQFKK